MKIEVFTAQWCSQCKVLKRILEEINVDYIPIDIDTIEGGEAAQRDKVRGLPTLKITTDSVTLFETGCKSKAYYLQILDGLSHGK